jgi:hypothetical protein
MLDMKRPSAVWDSELLNQVNCEKEAIVNAMFQRQFFVRTSRLARVTWMHGLFKAPANPYRILIDAKLWFIDMLLVCPGYGVKKRLGEGGITDMIELPSTLTLETLREFAKTAGSRWRDSLSFCTSKRVHS